MNKGNDNTIEQPESISIDEPRRSSREPKPNRIYTTYTKVSTTKVPLNPYLD